MLDDLSMLGSNVRIRSSKFGTVLYSCTVRPSESDTRMPRIWADLELAQKEEPNMGWTLEARGTERDWHTWTA